MSKRFWIVAIGLIFIAFFFLFKQGYLGNNIIIPGIWPTNFPAVITVHPVTTGYVNQTLAPTSVIGRGKCDGQYRADECPPGCVYYGVPLGCITKEDAENCANSKYGCPICLSSSTNIDTINGRVSIKDLKVGMQVWTVNNKGEKELQPIIKLSSVEVGNNHAMIHLILSDGRELFVSPNHPTADGRLVNQLKIGDKYDSSIVRTMVLVLYSGTKTYDLLPAGDTGYYFANGILMGSTLK